MTYVDACDACLRRTELLRLLATRIERGGRGKVALGGMLALSDDDLIDGLGARSHGPLHAARAAFRPAAARAQIHDAGLSAVCCHAVAYPPSLGDLEDAPAMLHVAGRLDVLTALCAEPPEVPAIALVGARDATPYGLDTARSLGRGLATAGVTVVSGMALGVDSAAHTGALAAGGRTIAVLAGGADVPYPASKRALYERILREGGCAISELPPGSPIMRWAFPARNRTIAALSAATIVVEARDRSGSLITAEIAADIGRPVGAVPGPVTGSRSGGTNALLHDGAAVIRDAADALDLAASPVTPLRRRPAPRPRGATGGATAVATPSPPALTPELRHVADAVEEGADSPERLAAALGCDVRRSVIHLTQLELAGVLRRRDDGTYALRVAT